MENAAEAAESPDWRTRTAAGRELAALPDLAPAAGTLLRLLLDPQDTAVTSNTALALLERGDAAGLELVLRAASRGDYQQVQWLASAFNEYGWQHGHEAARARCEPYTRADDAELSAGARHLTAD